jgi:hypothetical protein
MSLHPSSSSEGMLLMRIALIMILTNFPGSGTSGLDSDSILARSPSLGSSTCISSQTKLDDLKPISKCFPSNLPCLRYLKLKASTREGLYGLLKMLPIGTLRVWAIEYSIPPNGPRHVKSSLLHPLIDHFITTIDTVESYSAPELSSLLKPTTSPLLLSVPVLQYHYLLQLFPEQFLRRVMYVQRLNTKQLDHTR